MRPMDLFHNNKSKPDGKQTVCKDCKKKSDKKYYQDNKPQMRESIARSRSDRNKKNQALMIEYLDGRNCVECGERDVRVLEFDHRERSEKKSNISTLMSDVCSWDRILEEIALCDILCANCHRIKTHEENNSYKHRALISSISGPTIN